MSDGAERATGKPSVHPETLVARAGGAVDEQFGSVVPPIFPSAPYRRDATGRYLGGHSYSRDQNPTFDPAERLLTELEGGADALLFASGMAAASAVLEALSPGAHVVVPSAMYWTIRRFLEELGAAGRLDVSFIPTGDLDALGGALRPNRTELVWVESPANPRGEITDLSAAAEMAHAAGARICADGTLATPVLTRPLELGCDLVLHSATKQLNGHADVVAGALVAAERDAFWGRVRHERGMRGGILGPFEAWLLLRGMRTLYLRVRASARGAMDIAEALVRHPAVVGVDYPGLPDHPGHAIAARQMTGGFGPVVSFRLGSPERARALASSLRLFHDASSLGGVESLVEHRAVVEGEGSPVPDDLLRLSIGIEEPADLIEDLIRALDGLSP